MGEIIKDTTTGDWVIISPARSKRPNGLHPRCAAKSELPEHDSNCPFCEGNESKTPQETMAYRKSGAPNSGGWDLRIFPNLFPVLEGKHEVIVESPNHSVPFFLQGSEKTENVLKAYVERFSELAKDPRNKTICIFRNQGKNAGASLIHPHSQIISAPVESMEIAKRRRAAAEFLAKNGKCPMCAIVEDSKSSGLSIYENRQFAAFCPPASKYPYETWIVPTVHQSSIMEVGPESMAIFIAR